MSDNVQFAKVQSTFNPSCSRASKTRNAAFAPGAASPSARLVQARIARGYRTAAEAARAMGVSTVSYMHHECGHRGLRPDVAERYGRHYGVSGAFILYGNDPAVLQDGAKAQTSGFPEQAFALRAGAQTRGFAEQLAAVREVPVIGAIVAGARIVTRRESSIALPQTLVVPAFSGSELQSLIVADDTMYPAYSYGDVVLFAAPTAAAPGGLPGIQGRECVVETEAGERLLRKCHSSADGTWTLTSHNSAPLFNQRLVSAAPVLWVQRNTGAQLHMM